MRNRLPKFILSCSLVLLVFNCKMKAIKQVNSEDVSRIEMRLSAFGVESDGFPSINAKMDLKNDTSYCEVSYYDPKFSGVIYRLSKADLDSVRYLVTHTDLRSLKKEYRGSAPDQPASTTIFYIGDDSIKVLDYDRTERVLLLDELYRLVYKLDIYAR